MLLAGTIGAIVVFVDSATASSEATMSAKMDISRIQVDFIINYNFEIDFECFRPFLSNQSPCP